MGKNSVYVLLVEDKPGDADLFRRMLTGMGHNNFMIVQCLSLDETLGCLDRGHFDVILLDLSVPDSQGLATFLAVHEHASDIPIVVLTGYDDEVLATQAVRRGAQDYLIKGQVEKDLLVRSIRYAIERKRTEVKLLAYQGQLRMLSSQVSLTEERERRRIATELHDGLGQTLALTKMKLAALRESTNGRDMTGALDEIRDLIGQAIKYTRSVTFELSSPILYELGLEPAIEALVEQYNDRYPLQVEFRSDKRAKPLDENLRAVLFQAVRELLINVVKHARARTTSVSVERVDHEIRITVQDDGVGFETTTPLVSSGKRGGFGLFNIRERLDYLGGICEVHSAPDRGTRVVLRAPLTGGEETEMKRGVAYGDTGSSGR